MHTISTTRRRADEAPAAAVRSGGFTLIELLVVMAIIGVLATIGLPALKGIGKGTAINSAQRQILDDLALARLTALNSRSRVCVVFLPPMPNIEELNLYVAFPESHKTLLNIFPDQMASYAILSERRVGDQPGQSEPAYVLQWRRLPEGIMVAPWNFLDWRDGLRDASDPLLTQEDFPFDYRTDLPFPVDQTQRDDNHPDKNLPCIIFEPTGQLALDVDVDRESPDRVLRLVPGAVLVGFDDQGTPVSADLPSMGRKDTAEDDRRYEETRIRISGMTGRASVEPVTML